MGKKAGLLAGVCLSVALAGCMGPPMASPDRATAYTGKLAQPSLGGLRLGDTEATLKQLNLTLQSSGDAPNGPAKAYKYTTQNGNDLSVTFKGGKLVWIENDWGANPDGADSLFPGVVFGKMTRDDVAARLGSNGFVYEGTDAHKINDYAISFSCFELSDAPGTTLCLVSRIPLAMAPADVAKSVGSGYKVVGVILAQDDYVHGLWGLDKVTDPRYHDLDWASAAQAPDAAALEAMRHRTDLSLSSVPTSETGFSLTLPAGFHRETIPGTTSSLNSYNDMLDARRQVAFELLHKRDKTETADVVLAGILGSLSHSHTGFQTMGAWQETVTGLEFHCSNWSGESHDRMFGGFMCTADRGDDVAIFSVLDYKSRYDDDKAVYKASFESLKLP